MNSFYSDISKELKDTIGGEIAILSTAGETVFSTFEVSAELKEAALIALKTKVRVNMMRAQGNVLIIPVTLYSKPMAVILVGYDFSEETYINLILKNIKCAQRKFSVFDKEVRENEINPDLAETLRLFFENDSSVIKTAMAMNVHRNTVLYRLNKIKELTGLDPKKFKDAVELYSMLSKFDK